MSTDRTIYNLHNALKSPIIITGPHNGWHVPQHYLQNNSPLGVEPYWFDPAHANRRHEACDWGMEPLFNAMAQRDKRLAMLSATHSRLVVDLNRKPETMIYSTSSELSTPIPGNMNLSPTERDKRLDTYYRPYHKALDQLLQDTKAKFGHVLWLDIHSFSPIWQGAPRNVGIGTLKAERSPFSDKAEGWLSKVFGETFKADEPYSMIQPEIRGLSGGYDAALRNGASYFGLEIRNDLLTTPEQISEMSDKIIDFISELEPS